MDGSNLALQMRSDHRRKLGQYNECRIHDHVHVATCLRTGSLSFSMHVTAVNVWKGNDVG